MMQEAALTSADSFIEIDSCQRAKHGQLISGDVFLSEKVKQEGRIVSVLSDGLGSGVKASVLASTTARTVNMSFNAIGPRTFHSDSNTYYSMARVDFLATQKIRLYAAWQYSYNRDRKSTRLN